MLFSFYACHAQQLPTITLWPKEAPGATFGGALIAWLHDINKISRDQIMMNVASQWESSVRIPRLK